MKELLWCIDDFRQFVTGNNQYGDLIREHKLRNFPLTHDKENELCIDGARIAYMNKETWTRACKGLLTNLSFLQTVCKLKEEF